MLPEGKKSLSAIAQLRDPVDRVRDLVTLLEYVVVTIYDKADRESLDDLLDKHQQKFSDFRSVDFARRIRNKLGHAKGRQATRAQIVDAEIALDTAVRDIIQRAECPEELRHDALGDSGPMAPKGLSSSP